MSCEWREDREVKVEDNCTKYLDEQCVCYWGFFRPAAVGLCTS